MDFSFAQCAPTAEITGVLRSKGSHAAWWEIRLRTDGRVWVRVYHRRGRVRFFSFVYNVPMCFVWCFVLTFLQWHLVCPAVSPQIQQIQPPAHHRSRRRSQNADSSLAKRSQRREAIKDGFIRRLSRCGTKYVGRFAYRLYFAPCTAAGLAQSVGRLTAEEEVAGFYS